MFPVISELKSRSIFKSPQELPCSALIIGTRLNADKHCRNIADNLLH